MTYIERIMSYYIYPPLVHEILHKSKYCDCPIESDGSKKCHLDSLRNSELRSSNMVLKDIEMLYAPEEGPILEQGEDVEMVDVPTKGIAPKEWTMKAGLDPKIIESNS